MNKKSNELILNFIASLLHPSKEIDKQLFFPAQDEFWNRFVKIGSSHLVLPALYAAILRKKIKNYIPKELIEYLQEIHNLNLARNKLILNQINHIADIFDSNDIDYVFIKGAAILISKPYNSICERMLGDIDVLVAQKDLIKSYTVLKTRGYSETSEIFFMKNINSHQMPRHIQRLVNPSYISAVEIHREALSHKNSHLLKAADILKSKKRILKFCVPSKKNIWLNTIYNWQYNDLGLKLNYFNFKSVIDVLYTEPKNIKENIGLYNNPIKYYYNLISIYYPSYKVSYPLKKIHYLLQTNFFIFFKLNKSYVKFIFLANLFFSRLALLSKSKLYRQRVFKNSNQIFKKVKSIWK